jgi:hypothetical protein
MVAGLPFSVSASDAEIVQVAELYAKACRDACGDLDKSGRYLARDGRSTVPHGMVGNVEAALYAVREQFVKSGIEPRFGKVSRDGVLRRALCPLWWRRQFRRAHARKLERVGIEIGMVHTRAEKYCTDETASRRWYQNRRNEFALQNAEVVNDLGQTYTVAELAALGMANKVLRRGEVMTRLRGFDDVAKKYGHRGALVTLTCPSRFHAVRWIDGQRNPVYEGFTPRDAQEHLRMVWARVRSACDHRGIRLYGMRAAEPHHDGCAHWHAWLFVAHESNDPVRNALAYVEFKHLLKFHALIDSPDEPGAREKRCDLKELDISKGSAASYAAKYVAKHLGADTAPKGEGDLFGRKATQSERVEAWATCWGIRQFQTVGGVPIGLWRAMRKVPKESMQGAPEQMRLAWDCAQRVEHEGETVKQADYGGFIEHCGGPLCGRSGSIVIAKEMRQLPSRYDGRRYHQMVVGVQWTRTKVLNLCESFRYLWAGKARTARPWTRVNNCTESAEVVASRSSGMDRSGVKLREFVTESIEHLSLEVFGGDPMWPS